MKRKTRQKDAIEKVFHRENRPLRVEEILKAGRETVGSMNQATIYRNLKLMVEKGQIKQINHPVLGNLYEMTGKEHHHHFYCRICSSVFDLAGCGLNEKEALPAGFVTEAHEVFLYGVCPSCGS
jgi:Fur family ferric uptake transcriptional regulator